MKPKTRKTLMMSRSRKRSRTKESRFQRKRRFRNSRQRSSSKLSKIWMMIRTGLMSNRIRETISDILMIE